MTTVATTATEKSAPARMSPAGAFFASALVVLLASASRATWKAPATLGSVGAFALTDQNGRAVSRSDLDGHPWLADFVFTRCGGPCPRLSQTMELLQAELGRSDARIVSFSVDPEHDTPAVLAEYARLHGAGERWSFLTGDVGAISSLLYDSFHLPMLRNPGAPPGQLVAHSTRVVLVDRAGKVRGYYAPLDESLNVDEAEMHKLVHDLRALGNGSRLPLVDAALNATSALLLLLGYAFILAGRIRAHATCMIAALAVSAAFLGCYLYYHATFPDTPFSGAGVSKALYLAVLIPHVILAVPIAPLAIATAIFGLKGNVARHRKLARLAFPLWIYVSVSGVAVYALLHEVGRP